MTMSGAIALQTEVEVFERLRLSLLDRAAGKYALVKGSDLVGTFGSEAEAIRDGYRRFGNEAFLVKHIVVADVPMNFTLFNLGI
jgi:hypothetical protein